jgi:hypothetical protein
MEIETALEIQHRQPSAEELAQWKRDEAERKQRQEKAERERAAARERADKLLRTNLSPEQREELDRWNAFHLYVGKKKYRIKRGRSRNVQLLDAKGNVVRTFCAHPRDQVPDEDTMLVQKLMLESQEEVFCKIANQS